MDGWTKLIGELTRKAYGREHGLKAAERIDDDTAVNLGTMERVRVMEAVWKVLEYTGYQAEIKLWSDMPTGPMNRVADSTLASRLLGWVPQVPFAQGLKRTCAWYFATKDREVIEASLERKLIEH
jgi:nucleoside-diphosphate-sugar epimerase